MSRTSPQEKRLRFFERGNTHCPICLTQFTEPDVRTGKVVTLEHAPQESVGGKSACLTCVQCNTGPSTGIDRPRRGSTTTALTIRVATPSPS